VKPSILIFIFISFLSCKKEFTTPADQPPYESINEDLVTYREISSIKLGGAGAAEISDFDPSTGRLFIVENGALNHINVLDISNPVSITGVGIIPVASWGGNVNSVSVHNGMVAAAIESGNKQEVGKVVVFDTKTFTALGVAAVGALPKMITFSPDGKYILTANEGKPNDSYTVDPEGSISIIKVADFSVRTINFSGFEGSFAALTAKGMRIFGPAKNFLQDIEPEYITVSRDSRTAWVTLQENNAIARINVAEATIAEIMPLGYKNYSLPGNQIDPSDRDNKIDFSATYKNLFGIYMPDGVANLQLNGKNYLFTANEGDAREYAGFSEVKSASTLTLDPVAFPDRATLRTDAKLGRLNLTNTLGDTDGDGDFDQLYSFGARSFSVWDGNSGVQIFDSGNELDFKAQLLNLYDDARSYDKSVEPESVVIGWVGNRPIAIVGLTSIDAFAIYDISNPEKPVFVKMYPTGDGPEGILFIPANKSPIGQSLIVVCSENDAQIKIYKANKL
jgi:DNA-binding beta-propeller fold protein YncE